MRGSRTRKKPSWCIEGNRSIKGGKWGHKSRERVKWCTEAHRETGKLNRGNNRKWIKK